MISPYDFNQSIAHRAEYVEERLKSGAPVVGLSFDGGVLFVAARRSGHKIYEIYDQIMMGATGAQADIEAVRLASIDFCHQEGFTRSPDDVSLQRLVGFVLSPPLKRAFGDPMTAPNVLRALFAEVGRAPESDSFFELNYDGEFVVRRGFTAIAGTQGASERMSELLSEFDSVPDLTGALGRARDALRAGLSPSSDATPSENSASAPDALQTWLDEGGQLEAAVLDRNTPRESRFRLLKPDEMD